ncbi:MAG: hypothetical protein ACTSV1_03765 [Alphaproteobacteria bacterium]
MKNEFDWRQTMKGGQGISGIDGGYTVFRGLEEAKVAGRELAAALGVTPSAYSKWRSGHIRIPRSRLVFLTLILADRLETLEATAGRDDPRFLAHLKSLRRSLDFQERLNRKLSPDDVQEGSRMYRKWWLKSNAGAAAIRETVAGEIAL